MKRGILRYCVEKDVERGDIRLDFKEKITASELIFEMPRQSEYIVGAMIYRGADGRSGGIDEVCRATENRVFASLTVYAYAADFLVRGGKAFAAEKSVKADGLHIGAAAE